eukprot:34755-Eustigmatos_ZCMA.PRE.1
MVDIDSGPVVSTVAFRLSTIGVNEGEREGVSTGVFVICAEPVRKRMGNGPKAFEDLKGLKRCFKPRGRCRL